MILQELIRNIVLYKGVINPVLQLVKEYMVTQLTLQKAQSLSTVELNQPQQEVSFAKVPMTTTDTLPVIISNESLGEANAFEERIESSSTLSVVLRGSRLFNWIDGVSKTCYSSSVTLHPFMIPAKAYTGSLTTGSYIEKAYLFFSHETHEKREYLGEFSLPHEEIQFKSLLERR